MLREKVSQSWTTLRQKVTKQKSYLEVYQNSNCLFVKITVENKPLILELLSKHKSFTFLNMLLDKKFINSERELDLTSLPAIYRLSILNNITKDFKLRCKVNEASGSPGFGFKKIDDSKQWYGTGIGGNCETLYVFDKTRVSNNMTRREAWDGSKPVVDEVRWKPL